jgi:YD repeat-containing protein
MQWNEIVDGDKIYAPGNRIKKINNFTADSNLEFSKWYSYVNESNNSPNGALFSTSNFRIVKYMVGQFPIYENIKYSNKGLELSKIFYNRENGLFKKVKEINNDYLLNNSILISLSGSDFIGGMYSFGFEIEKPLAENFPTHPYVRNRTQFCYPNSTGKNLNHYVYNSTLVYGYRTSFFTGGTLDLHETKVTEYFDNGQEMETVTTYGYDYNNHYNVASVSTTNSFGEISETKYQYAKNISNAVNDALVTNNMVAIPLITETFKNGEKLSTVETQYKNWDNVLLAPEFIKASKGSAPLETRLIYNLVDPANGNPLQVQKEGGMTICYIWGYNKTQPVAKIENITYSAIPSTRIQAIENATNEASLITALNALRNDTALSNAMVTTYTYKLLVGISTVTDPKGDKQTYHYDGFGRLQYVKDAEENILSENQYHYRTQN